MNSDKTFSRTNPDAIVGLGAGRSPLPMPRVRELPRRYLARLVRETSRKARGAAAPAHEVQR